MANLGPPRASESVNHDLEEASYVHVQADPQEEDPPERPPVFAVKPLPQPGPPGVRARGEIDLSVGPELAARIEAGVAASEGAFVVDLCNVDFMDTTGVSVLLRARAVLARDDRSLAVICPPGPVRRIFEVAGVADLFVLFDSRSTFAPQPPVLAILLRHRHRLHQLLRVGLLDRQDGHERALAAPRDDRVHDGRGGVVGDDGLICAFGRRCRSIFAPR